MKIEYLSETSSYTFSEKSNYEKAIDLTYRVTYNDFVKMDDNRLVFISTYDYYSLSVILFHLYDNFSKMTVRFYKYNKGSFIYNFANELSAFIYNGYIAFTSTILPSNKKVI